MLCRSIAEKGFEKILSLLKGAEIAEIRIEKSGLSSVDLKKLFDQHANLIATCRAENLTDIERSRLLKTAIDGGAQWVDIEIESKVEYREELVKYAKSKKCKVIISYHNYENTPGGKELDSIVNQSVSMGANLIKIACLVNDIKDNARLFNLYNSTHPILAIGMGNLGKISRVAALKLGAPFTFVSYSKDGGTAPGQLTEVEMESILKFL